MHQPCAILSLSILSELLQGNGKILWIGSLEAQEFSGTGVPTFEGYGMEGEAADKGFLLAPRLRKS